jgi:hypothetical protein
VERGAGSSISIVLAGRPGDRGSIPGRGKKIFSLTSVSRPALGPTMGTGGSFPRGKARPGRDADHLPPTSAKVENE